MTIDSAWHGATIAAEEEGDGPMPSTGKKCHASGIHKGTASPVRISREIP
jgi:hypothetical protein